MAELLVLASTNWHKLEELKQLLTGLSVELCAIDAFPGYPEVVEDGVTFAANAAKKARAAATFTRHWALADDSGLEVDALDGAPGVYSARFAGEPRSDARNNAKLLGALAGVPRERRQARFRCVIALAGPDGSCETVDGQIDGVIGFAPEGENGFGYDPLFVVPEEGCTFARLSAARKNEISHRGRAVAALRAKLLAHFGQL